jgi:uncharacterized membrane protein
MILAMARLSVSRREAQGRADRLCTFRNQLLEIEQDGVLTLSDEQRHAVDRYVEDTLARLGQEFDIDTSDTQKRMSWGMQIVSLLGGIALCLAVVLFFYRYWGLLSTPVQVVLLGLTPVAGLAGAEIASRHEKTLYYASLLCLVAIGGFILNLSVLGAIFNLPSDQTALAVWGAFALAVGYAYGLRLPLLVGLGFLIGYVAAEIMMGMGWNWQNPFQRPESLLLGGVLVLAFSWLLPASGRIEFAWIYRLVGLTTLLVAVLVLSVWGEASALGWAPHTVEVFYQFAGLAFSLGAVWLGGMKRQASLMNLGGIFFAIFIYVRLFDWWWEWMPKYLFFLTVGLVSLGLLALFRRLRLRSAGEAR